ncbi:DMT family transporter [Tranquillimonas rosea]|uniref:DMT family transporter n=1 Tax=Tranquillimonas rosea TaxID=641238 RepID=UPI003BAA6618
MHHDSATRLASVIVIATGTLWGLYWLPVRRLSELGLTGAWGSLAIVAAAALLLAPVALVRRRAFAGSDRLAVASVLLGGAAFALYSVALVYGRVAIIILLFFLTPVWSTLIARYALRWPTPRLRVLAIACGLLGLGVMLGADGTLPRPRSAGEWLALVSGMLWAVASTGIRLRAPVAPPEAAFVFATGACLGAASVAPFLAPWPSALPAGHLGPAVGWVLLAGGLWWGLSMAGLMWATARLDPARVGILLMAEVLVGAASAALIAGERLGPLELAGGALVLAAGVLEVWPVRRR